MRSPTSASGARVRTTVRELQLRATKVGTLLIGAVHARQGRVLVATDPIVVTVDSGAAGGPPALTPLARALVDAAPPPERTDRVALTVVVPTDTVLAGQQLDVVATAWFPRELRNRLHRPPQVTIETPQRVWAYPAARSSDVAASRLVRGSWLDLYVAHQVVFPLAAGRVVIPPASVEFAVPTTFSFFSREERYALQSDSVMIVVLPLPVEGRPADDQRVTGRGLVLALDVQPADARVGEPLEVTTTVAGVGNVALWPEPSLRWPPGFRPYAAEPEARIDWQGGRISGSKVFRYLVVPDSAGTFVLPELRYPYYDMGRGGYTVAGAAPRTLVVAPGAEPRAARSLPPLAPVDGAAWATWRSWLLRSSRCWGCWGRSRTAGGGSACSRRCAARRCSRRAAASPKGRAPKRCMPRGRCGRRRTRSPPGPRPNPALLRTGTTWAPPCTGPARTARLPQRGPSRRALPRATA